VTRGTPRVGSFLPTDATRGAAAAHFISVFAVSELGLPVPICCRKRKPRTLQAEKRLFIALRRPRGCAPTPGRTRTGGIDSGGIRGNRAVLPRNHAFMETLAGNGGRQPASVRPWRRRTVCRRCLRQRREIVKYELRVQIGRCV
jgi:hypothetical protein